MHENVLKGSIQAHDDGSLEPLSGLASSPSYFHTWPFRLARRLWFSALPYVPSSLQSSLPASLQTTDRPYGIEGNHAQGYTVDTPTNGSNGSAGIQRKDRKARRGTETPQETSTTDEELEELDEGAADGVGGGKKKKRGLGKASVMRRRKMGAKR